MAMLKETDALKPIDKVIERMVSEVLGCNENEHRGGLESEYIQRLSPQP